MAAHTIKSTHEDGVELKFPISWCGKEITGGFHFVDTHHLVLSVGGSIQSCKNCVSAVIRELQKEVQSNGVSSCDVCGCITAMPQQSAGDVKAALEINESK